MDTLQQIWKTNKPGLTTPQDMLELLAKLK